MSHSLSLLRVGAMFWESREINSIYTSACAITFMNVFSLLCWDSSRWSLESTLKTLHNFDFIKTSKLCQLIDVSRSQQWSASNQKGERSRCDWLPDCNNLSLPFHSCRQTLNWFIIFWKAWDKSNTCRVVIKRQRHRLVFELNLNSLLIAELNFLQLQTNFMLRSFSESNLITNRFDCKNGEKSWVKWQRSWT